MSHQSMCKILFHWFLTERSFYPVKLFSSLAQCRDMTFGICFADLKLCDPKKVGDCVLWNNFGGWRAGANYGAVCPGWWFSYYVMTQCCLGVQSWSMKSVCLYISWFVVLFCILKVCNCVRGIDSLNIAYLKTLEGNHVIDLFVWTL